MTRLLFACWFLGIGSAFLVAAPIPKVKETIPKQTLQAWEAAGATITWGSDIGGAWHFLPAYEESEDTIPVMSFKNCNFDASRLPQFPCSFGLSLVKSWPENFLEGFPSAGQVVYLAIRSGAGSEKVLAEKVTDDDFRMAARFKSLRTLDLRSTDFGDAGMATLRNYPFLTHLDIHGTKVTDEGLKHLAAVPRLAALHIADTGIKEDGLAHLIALEHLEFLECNMSMGAVARTHFASMASLRMFKCPGSSNADAVLAAVCYAGTLTDLEITMATIDYGMAFLERCKNLRNLVFDDCNMPDECLVHLRHLEHLESAVLSIDDQEIKYLAELKSLKHLSIYNSKLSSRSLLRLARLRQLESLQLRNVRTKEGGIKLLGNLVELETLQLIDCDLAETDLSMLRRMKKLTTLSLSGTHMPENALFLIGCANGVRELDLRGTGLSRYEIPELMKLRSLEHLVLDSELILAPVEYKQLCEALPRCKVEQKHRFL